MCVCVCACVVGVRTRVAEKKTSTHRTSEELSPRRDDSAYIRQSDSASDPLSGSGLKDPGDFQSLTGNSLSICTFVINLRKDPSSFYAKSLVNTQTDRQMTAKHNFVGAGNKGFKNLPWLMRVYVDGDIRTTMDSPRGQTRRQSELQATTDDSTETRDVAR